MYVLGGGSVGCLVAAYVGRCTSVTLLVRTEQALRAVQRQGGILLERKGHVELVPCRAQIQGTEPIEHLMVTTKAYDVADALRGIQHRLSPSSTVLLLQNGLGVQEKVAVIAKVMMGVNTHGAYRKAPFHVVHAGQGSIQMPETSSDILSILQQTSLNVKTVSSEDMERQIKTKLVINCCINPLTALWQCRNGEILERKEGPGLMEAIAEECSTVLNAEGYRFDAKALLQLAINTAKATAANQSSMLQDVLSDRGKTEMRYLNGWIVREGQRLGIPTPVNLDMVEQVEALLAS